MWLQRSRGVKNLEYFWQFLGQSEAETNDIDKPQDQQLLSDKPKLALGGKAVRACMGRKYKSAGAQLVTVSHRFQQIVKVQISFVHNIAVLRINAPFLMPSNLIGFGICCLEGTIFVQVHYLFIMKIILKVQ